MRTSIWLIKKGDKFEHGSETYNAVGVYDYGDYIAVWYSTPTGVKRRTFYPDAIVYLQSKVSN